MNGMTTVLQYTDSDKFDSEKHSIQHKVQDLGRFCLHKSAGGGFPI